MLVRVLGDFGSGGEIGVGSCQHGENLSRFVVEGFGI